MARATTALLVLSFALAAVAGAGALAGYRGQVVLTGSMQPTLAPGDLVVVRQMPAAELRPGQVISFGAKGGVTVTHRVKAVDPARNGRIAVTTQGDANNASERWVTTPDATVGRMVASVPRLGSVTRWTGSPTGRLLVLGTIGLLIAGFALRKIWSS